jgi:hypothetical protein
MSEIVKQSEKLKKRVSARSPHSCRGASHKKENPNSSLRPE